MHFSIAWNISPAVTDPQICEQRIMGVVSNYNRYNPFRNYWIIQVPGIFQYNQFVSQIEQINIDGLDILITPLMNGGQYRGMLPNLETWQNINLIGR
jgi:hypothetical protein